MNEISMFITRTPWSRPTKGSMAGIPTSLETKDGIPVCYGVDEIVSGTERNVEPLPERMIAVHGRTEELWIGVGDGKAIPLPQNFPLARGAGGTRIKIRIVIDAPGRSTRYFGRTVVWPFVPAEGDHVELNKDGYGEYVRNRLFDSDGTARLHFAHRFSDADFFDSIAQSLLDNGWS